MPERKAFIPPLACALRPACRTRAYAPCLPSVRLHPHRTCWASCSRCVCHRSGLITEPHNRCTHPSFHQYLEHHNEIGRQILDLLVPAANLGGRPIIRDSAPLTCY
jgi:hypothetical protein